ncbi:F-box domain, Leucine-rich repeat domain, L domain-like protein [Artemisia annua]|uniref:F-box domain, Leucine-rich repeat domain, L domain-like protein n=1 Tax=Artemisia annua TaxID=35608 RepID=A0A2U1NKF1_ARTAN|nr:F-box domain, Leucine-rich repeat domain, L domain-like protein [Artemisia annua]
MDENTIDMVDRISMLPELCCIYHGFCEQNISAHTLNIRTSLFEPKEVKIVEDCVASVLKKGVHVLGFLMGYTDLKDLPKVRLPDTLLSASLLTSLYICDYELPLSLMVDGVKLESLKLLNLVLVVIDEGVIEHLIAGSPLLREISLSYCHGLTTFNVCIHHNLQKDKIYCKSRLERIDINIEAPNLRYFIIMNIKNIAPSMNMVSCQKLTTFCYQGPPLESFTNILSSFPVIENFSLWLPSYCKNLKLSNHSLRRLELHSHCDSEDIHINTLNLLLFECYDDLTFTPSLGDYSYPLKACMECHTNECDDPFGSRS